MLAQVAFCVAVRAARSMNWLHTTEALQGNRPKPTPTNQKSGVVQSGEMALTRGDPHSS